MKHFGQSHPPSPRRTKSTCGNNVIVLLNLWSSSLAVFCWLLRFSAVCNDMEDRRFSVSVEVGERGEPRPPNPFIACLLGVLDNVSSSNAR